MNNKGVGAIFCLIAAILAGARYLAAAIYLSGAQSWDTELFSAGLGYVGAPLKIAAIAALIVGVVLLAVGIVQDCKKQ